LFAKIAADRSGDALANFLSVAGVVCAVDLRASKSDVANRKSVCGKNESADGVAVVRYDGTAVLCAGLFGGGGNSTDEADWYDNPAGIGS